MQMRSRAGRVAAAVTIAAVAATSATVATATAATSTPTTTSPAKAAAGFLARHLTGPHKDHYAVTFQGTAYPDAGETADGVLGMDAAGVAQDAAKRATAWLAANAKSYAAGSGSYYPGSLAKLLLVAEAQHADLHSFGGLDLVKLLQQDEQPDGSFGNTGDKQYGTTVVGDALSLIALTHAHSLYAWPDAKAIGWLAGQQCGDGGFTNTVQATPAAKCADVDTTAYAAQALLQVHSRAAALAMHWLLVHQNRDGGFGLAGAQQSSNANSTALAVQALREAGYGYGKALTWLAKHQQRCSAPSSRRGAVVFQSSYDADTAIRATTQAAQALALKYLGGISNTNAAAAAPALTC
jgi:hypothetical protein